MEEYELEETTEITIADNPIGKLLLLITVVLSVLCLAYFCTELTRPEPAAETTTKTGVSVATP